MAPTRVAAVVHLDASNETPTCEIRGAVAGVAAQQPCVVFARVGGPSALEPQPSVLWRRADGAFDPPLLVVCAGQEIRLVNDERLCHRFFSAQAEAFDVGLLRPGEHAAFRLEQPGPVPVYCALHGGRQATILVVPTPFFAEVSAAGEFAMTGLPPGPCVLETWSEGAAPARVEFNLTAGGLDGIVLAVPAAGPGR